jgi:cyclic lactone autoinducer peptide
VKKEYVYRLVSAIIGFIAALVAGETFASFFIFHQPKAPKSLRKG